MRNRKITFLISSKTYIVCTQKNRLRRFLLSIQTYSKYYEYENIYNFTQIFCLSNISKKDGKAQERYNQVPQLTQDTRWESNKNTIIITKKSQAVSPFPAGDHKAAMNRRESMKNTGHKNTNDQQQKLPPSNGQLKPVSGRQPHP